MLRGRAVLCRARLRLAPGLEHDLVALGIRGGKPEMATPFGGYRSEGPFRKPATSRSVFASG